MSNEIFYRVAKLRSELKPTLPTGHFHINKYQNVNKGFDSLGNVVVISRDDFENQQAINSLKIVKRAIEEGIKGIK